MTLAIAGLALSAIFFSSSSRLLSAAVDKERGYRLAALAAIEMARDSIQRFSLVDTIPNAASTPMQLFSGLQVRDATGTVIPNVRVNVWAAMTGDTLGAILPTVTVIAQAYDTYGVRFVQRADLRPESYSRFAMFVNGNVTHGPGVIGGRAHANGDWSIVNPGTQLSNIFLDTLSATGTITDNGSGQSAATFVRGTQSGAVRIDYPRDSTYAWMQTVAGLAGLDLNLTTTGTALGGGANTGGSRVEFVSFDANGNGVSEAGEGFLLVVDMSPGYRKRRGVELTNSASAQSPAFSTSDDVIQHQCGAFYRRPATGGTFRWHFFPVSAHRRTAFQSLITSTAAGSYPQVSAATYTTLSANTAAAVKAVLEQPTARCFPAGSPYLMPSERFTQANTLQHSGTTAAFQTPWGASSQTPSGGWYGGADTTYSGLLKTCTVQTNGNCQGGTVATLGALRPFGGTLGSSQVADTAMRRYLWPLSSPYNGATTNRGLVNVRVATGDTLYLSGTLRGKITMRVAGGVILPDRIRYEVDPNDPSVLPCRNQLGLIAVRDILVGIGVPARLYGVGSGASAFTLRGGGEARFTIHGTLMSLTGSVGVDGDSLDFGPNQAELSCPEDETTIQDDSNGGCFSITGGLIMNTYKPFYRTLSGRSNLNTNVKTRNGMRFASSWDRCNEADGRPPYFPVTTRIRAVRSLEIGVTRANTPSKVQTYLRRLLGKPI
jgi:hypothetical protein